MAVMVSPMLISVFVIVTKCEHNSKAPKYMVIVSTTLVDK